jgi:hypothetical protein
MGRERKIDRFQFPASGVIAVKQTVRTSEKGG